MFLYTFEGVILINLLVTCILCWWIILFLLISALTYSVCLWSHSSLLHLCFWVISTVFLIEVLLLKTRNRPINIGLRIITCSVKIHLESPTESVPTASSSCEELPASMNVIIFTDPVGGWGMPGSSVTFCHLPQRPSLLYRRFVSICYQYFGVESIV